MTTSISSVRAISLTAALALAISGTLLGTSPAYANADMTPVINFDGNVLASSVVHSEKGERIEQYQLALYPLPLSRVMTTDRSGYTFGGWSYRAGDPAVKTLETATATSTRLLLFAVWNTKLTLDGNGATRGSSTTVDYRFSQDLVLPGAGTLKRKGYNFGGWMPSLTPSTPIKTYRAGPTDNGNPTLYAAWTRTVTFKPAGGKGAIPGPLTYFAGGDRLTLPTSTSLTREGFEFVGWSISPRGRTIKNTDSYLPRVKNTVLHAVWKKN